MAFIEHNMGKVSLDLSALLRLYAQKVQADVDEVLQKKAEDLRGYAEEGSPRSNEDHAHFQDAWEGPNKLGHAHYEVRNDTDYGPIIEFGGYRSAGPKTAEQGGETLPVGHPRRWRGAGAEAGD